MQVAGLAVASSPSSSSSNLESMALRQHSLSLISLSPIQRFGLPQKPSPFTGKSRFGVYCRLSGARVNCSRHAWLPPRALKRMTDDVEVVESDVPSSSKVVHNQSSYASMTNIIGENIFLCLQRFGSTKSMGVLGAATVVFGTSALSLAGTIEVPPPNEAEPPTDYLLSFLFVTAAIALVIVTIGVIYLSVSEFLENRRLAQLQREASEELRENEKVDRVKIGGAKGFGPPKVEKKAAKGKVNE